MARRSARTVLLAGIGALLPVGGFACGPSGPASPHELEWNEEEGYRWADLQVASTDRVGFEALSPEVTGIHFENRFTDEQAVENRIVLNGSGVAAGDATGNGFPDLYFTRTNGPNVLYENQGGYRFREVTEEAGVALDGQYSTGAAFADLDGNGHLDLIVTSLDGPNRLFFNDGTGVFEEREDGLPTEGNYGSTSVAVADFNRNGALDIYVANYKEISFRDVDPYRMQFRFLVERDGDDYRIAQEYRDHFELEQVEGLGDDLLGWVEKAEPDLLYFNDGEGNFEKAPLHEGVLHDEDGEPITEPVPGWGLHVKAQDLNGNGLPDLYVANDFTSEDRIWMNRGDGTFQAIDRLALRKGSISAMAVDFSDIDRDGELDFFVVEMVARDHGGRITQTEATAPRPQPIGAIENRPRYRGNSLYLGRGDGTWAEISEYAGVRRSEWSWSTVFLDVDLDGYEDALVTNGHWRNKLDADRANRINQRVSSGELDVAEGVLVGPELRQRNVAFRNRGDLTFDEVGREWGFTDEDISHGMALADLNNDGTLDVVVNRLDDTASVYRNLADRPRVGVRLRGESPNTRAVGAQVSFVGGPVARQTREVSSAGPYLSGSQYQQTFAAGDGDGRFAIEVVWPDGSFSRVEGVQPNRIYEIDEAEIPRSDPPEPARPDGGAAEVEPLFEDRSDRLDHVHQEERFRDFELQSLLPWRLSQEGPAVTWYDWTGSGEPDLFLGSGAGGALAFFENHGDSLERTELPPVTDPTPLDQAGIVGFDGPDGRRHLLVGVSSYEAGPGEDSRVLHYVDTPGGGAELRQELRVPGVAIGPLALADYTGDGHPDLFVGGRVVPGRYPEPTSSFVYRNDGGFFELDEAASSAFEDVGMVTGAVFSDLDGNGRPELLLATDWGPLRVFAVSEGRFEERTEAYGLEDLTGLWRGVATGDLTGNGRPDIVATNHGENFWAPNLSDGPVRLHYADFNGDGTLEIMKAYRYEGMEDWVPRRRPSAVGNPMPFILDRVRTYRAYSRATLGELMGARLEETRHVEAGHFQHTLLLNREDGLEPTPLPTKAQLAPAFGALVADVDGNGHQDVILAQNFFAYHVDVPRGDAGRGLLLKGDGEGGLTPEPGHRSGIRIYGEQRGLAAADVDGDGRLDLVVTQNAASTRYLENAGAREGLRVTLRGPPSNPSAIGARARLHFPEGGQGPVREVQAGSGYWSQQPQTLVLGHGEREPEGVAVRWPDGSESFRAVEAGQGSVEIRWQEVAENR